MNISLFKLCCLILLSLSPGVSQTFDISGVNGINGIVIKGIDANDNSGFSVSSAGDVNGDGVDDIIIGAAFASPNGNTNAGECYVVFGSSSGFTSPLELSSLDGTNGFIINGINANDYSSYSVSTAGDFNNDGFSDIITSAYAADPGAVNNAGEAYIIFGKATFTSPLELSTLNGLNGFTIFGEHSNESFGMVTSTAGDINNDNIPDVLIGEYYGSPDGRTFAGRTYVLFGSTSPFNSTMTISDLNGSNGFVINGIDANDNSGIFMNTCGDINNDNIDDIIIGAHNANGATGESYVVFGRAAAFDSVLELSALDGSNGFILNGVSAGDLAGFSVSGAGDINGDNINDIIIGAPDADPGGASNAGEEYVIFGTNSFSSPFNLSSLNGTNGLTISGIDANDSTGFISSNAGDFNNDGFDDIIIGAQSSDPGGKINAGKAYIVYGTGSLPATFPLSSIDGNNGMEIRGGNAGDNCGFSVKNAGDVNGDGVSDVIIGAPFASPNATSGAGETYILFGHVPPTVTTSAVTSIAKTTATANGEIVSLGTDTVLQYGVCWNTTGTPTTTDNLTNEGSITTTGTFTGSLTGLSSWTTYYVRSYAINQHGTSYGNEVSFTTINNAPTVSTAIPDTSVPEDFGGPVLFRDLNTIFNDAEEGSALTFSEITLLGNVGAFINVDSVLVINSIINANGIDSIIVTATDAGALTVSDTVIITVNAENDAPTIAAPIPDTTLTEDFTTILYRDLNTVFTDIEEAAALTFTVNSLQNRVTPTINTDSVLIISSISNENGIDTLIITATDAGALTVSDTVIITVTAENDAPTIAAPIPDTTLTEDFTTILYRDLNTVFTDVEEGTALTYYYARTLQGKLTLLIDQDTVLIFSAIPNYYGIDTVIISARDAGAITVEDTVIITIESQNDTPEIVNAITDTTLFEDFSGQISYRNLRTVFTDVEDGTNLTFSGISLYNRITPTIFNDSILQFSSLANANGIDTIVVTAADNGALVSYDTIAVTITPVNDAPTQTVLIPDTAVTEDFPQISYRKLTALFTDIEQGGALTYTVQSLRNITLPSVSSDSTLMLSSAANANGIDTIVVRATDNGALSVTDTAIITVIGQNDAPYIVSPLPDTTVTKDFITIVYRNLNTVFGDIENHAELTFTSHSTKGFVTPAISADSLFLITSLPGITGIDSVIISASDPEGLTVYDTLSIAIIPSPNAPTVVAAIADSVLQEDFTTITYRDLATVFKDIEDGTNLTYSIAAENYYLSASLDNSMLNLTSLKNVHGEETIICQAKDSDGLIAFDTLVITVSPVNDTPTLSQIESRSIPEDSYFNLTIDITDANDVDVSDNIFLIIESGENYTVDGDTIFPSLNFNGTLNIPVKVRDNFDTSAVAIFTLTVDPVNDAPTLSGTVPQTITYDSRLTIDFTMLENAIDPDGTTPAIIVSPGTNYSVEGLTITPNNEYSGELYIPIYLDDGIATSQTVTMRVTVIPPNEPPVITNVTPYLLEQDAQCTINPDNITVIDNNPDDIITVSILPGDNYTVVDNRTFIPSPGFFGTLTVVLVAFDGTDYSEEYRFPVEVRRIGTNSIPVLNRLYDIKIEKNSPVTLTHEMADMYDEDNDYLTFIILPGENYTVTGSAIIPATDFIGEIEISVRVSDGIDSSEIIYSTVIVFERVVDFNNGIITLETGKNSIYISPNPAGANDKSITISSESGESEELNISIFDPVGNKLHSVTLFPESNNRYNYLWNYDQQFRELGGSYIIYFRYYRDGKVSTVDKKMIGIVR